MSVRPRGERERGAALIVALALAAAAAAIAVALIDDLTVAVRRTASLSAREQTIWSIRGAEALAVAVVEFDAQTSGFRQTRASPWVAEPTVFPIDGGRITAQIRDDTRCFNINSLVVRGEGGFAANAEAARTYAALLRRLGFEEQSVRQLVDSAIDWMDGDLDRSPSGAEDPFYEDRDPPLLAANRPLVDVEELRGVAGYEAEIFAAVAPYLCAHAVGLQQAMNVNLLEERDALLLAAFAGEAVEPGAIARVIARAPADGWESGESFWAEAMRQQGLANEDAPPPPPLDVYSSHYRLNTQVRYLDAYMEGEAVMTLSSAGRARVLNRRLGPRG